MPVAALMVGLPCSGKSTFAKSEFDSYTILSYDKIITNLHPETTYDEAFTLSDRSDTVTLFNKALQSVVYDNKNVVIDNTNLTVNVRRNILKQLPPEYYKVAVVLNSDYAVLRGRNLDRAASGKRIPDHVMASMKKSFTIPTLEEGFDNIVMR